MHTHEGAPHARRTAGVVTPIDRIDVAHDPTLVKLHAEIVRAFHFFNVRFWDGKLPIPVFAFFPQPPRGSRLGHFWAKTWKDGGERRHEIVFYADLCLAEGIEQVVQTLLHEMVHLWQQEHGKPGRNNHHNKEWHREAQRVGLVTEGKKGYTTAGEGFKTALADLKPSDEAIPHRDPPKRAKGKMKLWMCACPTPFKIRVAREGFAATCDLCGSPFEPQES